MDIQTKSLFSQIICIETEQSTITYFLMQASTMINIQKMDIQTKSLLTAIEYIIFNETKRSTMKHYQM